MARVFLEVPMMSISGSLRKTDKYSYVTRNGKIFTRAKGERTTAPSKNELAARERFKRAVDWANLVQRSDELFLHYNRMWHTSSIQCNTFRGWLIKYYFKNYLNRA